MEDQQVQMWGEAPLASLVRERTERIKLHWQGMLKRTVADVWTLGTDLLAQQAELSNHHDGAFTAWLKEEMEPLGMSRQTAYRMMQVAQHFSCNNLLQLPFAVSALYLLAAPSTPDEARERALELAEQEEKITHARAKALVAETKMAAATQKAAVYTCANCHEDFPVAVWECPACHHHWPLDEPCDFCLPQEPEEDGSTRPQPAPADPDPNPYAAAKAHPAYRWERLWEEIYIRLGGITEAGGMAALAATWQPARCAGVARELRRVVEQLEAWADELEGTR
jgi:hypothetical protein